VYWRCGREGRKRKKEGEGKGIEKRGGWGVGGY